MRTGLVIDALAAAERTRGSLSGAVMHTGHRAQYTSRAFPDGWCQAGARQHVNAIGSSTDNAPAKSFNPTFKHKTHQDRRTWPSEHETHLDTFHRPKPHNPHPKFRNKAQEPLTLHSARRP
ncbi:hypothetical protein ACWGDX_00700 [Streptomyces sp. NPDC055025]